MTAVELAEHESQRSIKINEYIDLKHIADKIFTPSPKGPVKAGDLISAEINLSNAPTGDKVEE